MGWSLVFVSRFQDAARAEFEGEVERFLTTGERLFGPYQWGRYDLLIMPPSFPFGGMENPCLTFVTPCIVVGDRSLTDVVIHEIVSSCFRGTVSMRLFVVFPFMV